VLPTMRTAETDARALTDDVVIARVLAGDTASFEVLMRRYNQRVFRAARAVLRDESEAEDVVQDAWVRAYTHLRQFAGRASFPTWLTRIAIHESLARRRYRVRHIPLDEQAAALPARTRPPEQELGARQVARALEAAIDALPARYRTAFVLRDLEGLSTTETAACLDVPEATVKTRLHRARGILRSRLDAALGVSADGVYAFGGHRCDRIVAAVLARIGASSETAATVRASRRQDS
jgi:RNA polymerase sigma-70 factor (ECF subfamily)